MSFQLPGQTQDCALFNICDVYVCVYILRDDVDVQVSFVQRSIFKVLANSVQIQLVKHYVSIR